MKLAQLQEAQYGQHPAITMIYDMLEELYHDFSYRSTPMRNRHMSRTIRKPENIHTVIEHIIREFGQPTYKSDETDTVAEWEWQLDEWAPDDGDELREFVVSLRFLDKDPTSPAELMVEELV